MVTVTRSRVARSVTAAAVALVALAAVLGTYSVAAAEGFTVQIVVPADSTAPQPPAPDPDPRPAPDPTDTDHPGPLPRTGATTGLLATTALAVLACGVAILRRHPEPAPASNDLRQE